MRDGSRSDPDTAMGGPHAQFPSTQISLLQAASSGAAMPNEALERVTALYWKPIYRFIRLKFHRNNEDAKDLTQSFFATALRRDLFARFDPAQASFRTYLRMAVERFAATEYTAQNRQKRGCGIQFEPVDEQSATVESPEIRDLRSLRPGGRRSAILRGVGQTPWRCRDLGDKLSGVGTPYAAPVRRRTVARRDRG
jgi:DNA-directed RNA polymerase specialized sigma24 family protein